MEITRDVILDLLPLYVADEASQDTRALVEKYLAADPELAAIADRFRNVELHNGAPVPLTEEDEMATYKEAQLSLFWRTIIIAVVFSVILLACVVFGVAAMLFVVPSG